MNAETILIEKLRELKDEAIRYEKEASGLRKQAKGLEKMARAKRDQMDALLGKAVDPNQVALFGERVWRCERCGEEFTENPGETHDVEIALATDRTEDPENPDAPRTYGCGPVKQIAGPPPGDPDEGEEDEEEGADEDEEGEPEEAEVEPAASA
jgi:hypothetical protein